jgi:hypothetical protein
MAPCCDGMPMALAAADAASTAACSWHGTTYMPCMHQTCVPHTRQMRKDTSRPTGKDQRARGVGRADGNGLATDDECGHASSGKDLC